jgi:hypothetical protein
MSSSYQLAVLVDLHPSTQRSEIDDSVAVLPFHFGESVQIATCLHTFVRYFHLLYPDDSQDNYLPRL